MSFLTPLAFLGALLAGPIILMYMLRLRRREVEVSSTFLWKQVLQDNEANTPWQRLRRNLLLILQLIILALLVLALARPFMTVPAVSTGQIALLLDASASMNATDISGERTRFEAAQERALEIVNTMSSDDSMTVIRVADVPEVLSPETRDRALLRDAIQNAQPSGARADWNAALTLAVGTSRGEDFNLVVVGDGGLGDAEGLPGVQGEVQYVPVGRSSGNVAITALATRALAGQAPELFVQMTNYGEQDAEVILTLRVDGEIFTAQRHAVPADGRVPLVSEALPDDFGVIEASITPASGSDTQDFLPDDNVAYAVADNSTVTQALVLSAGNVFVDRILGSLPTVSHLTGNVEQGLPVRQFDLYVFDGYLPDALPDGDMLIINPPRSTDIFTVGSEEIEETDNPVIVGGDDRTAFLDFDSVNIRAFKPVQADWLEPLITVDGGVVLWAGENDGRQIVVMPFALGDSDLPLQIAWPILMNNLVDWFRPDAAVFADTALRTGDSLSIRPPAAADRVRVTKPDGTRREFEVRSDNVIYADTDLTGVYTVELFSGSESLQSGQFAVNLFDATESDIQPFGSIRLGDVEVTENTEQELGQREFWQWLALIALAVLMIEWMIYHRRLRGPGEGGFPFFRRRAAG